MVFPSAVTEKSTVFEYGTLNSPLIASPSLKSVIAIPFTTTSGMV